MTPLGLEYQNSRWRASGIGNEDFPEILAEGESVESLRTLLPDQNWDAITLALPYGLLRQEPQQVVELRQELESTFPNAEIRVIPRAVAASVAALWPRRTPDQTKLPLFEGQHILVCSFGNESSDFFIIQRGSEELPLVVVKQHTIAFSSEAVDAALVDALRNANQPVDKIAPEIIAGLRRTISRNLSRAVAGRKVIPARAKWADGHGVEVQTALSAELYLETLEVLLSEARENLISFLQEQQLDLQSIALCGDGADIHGVQQNIVTAALTQVYGAGSSLLQHQISVFSPHELVATGAALLAEGKISFQQKLPYNVGVRMQVEPNSALAELLKLPKDSADFWLYPLLSQGTALPAHFCSEDLEMFNVLEEGETLDWELYLADERTQHQKSQSLCFDTRASTVVNWEILADAQGTLHSRFSDENSRQLGHQEIEWFASNLPSAETGTLPTISPAQLKYQLDAQQNV